MGKARRLLCGALALLLALTLCACRTVRLENGETFVITRQAHGAGGGGEAEPAQTAAPEATPVEPDWTAVATPADEPNAADQPQANPADNNQVE